MSTDLAALGLSVRSDGVVVATDHLDKFKKSSDEAAKGADNLGAKSGALTKLARAAAPLAAAMAAAFSLGGVISGIAQFDTAMSRVQAITGATGADLEALRQIAQDLGASTEFSAAQAADGLAFLGMAGFSAAESMSAIPAVLDLATAAGMGLAEAADTASNIMSAFGIAAANAANVTDVLAAASSRANTNVQQLGQAISTAGPIAATLAIGIEDTAAAIGIMSDAGIQGERAGTALRGVLASLAGPTTQAQEALAQYGLTAADVNPATRTLADIMATLRAAGISTADAFTLFGREAASGALVLIDGADRLREFGGELRNVEGAAAAMARIMRDNLQGDLNGLSSAVAGLIIVLGDAGLTAILRAVIQGVTEVVRAVSFAVGALSNAITSVGDAIGGFEGYLIAAAAAATAYYIPAILASASALVAAYIPAIWAAIAATGAWVASLITLRGALLLTGIGALVVGAGALINMLLRLVQETGSWGNALALLGEVAAGVWEGIKTSASSIGPALGSVWETVKSGFYSMLAGISRRWESFLLGMAGAAANVPGLDTVSGELFGAAAATSAGTAGFESASGAAAARAAELSGEAASRIASGFDKAKEAVGRLNAAVKDTGDAVTEIVPPTMAATGAVADLGSAAGSAANAAEKATDDVKKLRSAADDWASSMAGHFDGLITGGKNLSGVLQSMARQLESTGWQMLFRGLSRGIFGGGGGGFLGSLFAGFFDQGGMIPAGQVGIVGERGPEFVRGPAVVTSRADTARAMAGGAAGGVIDVVLHVPEGVTVQQATAIAGSVAVRVTQGGLAQNRQALPRQIDQLNARGR